MKLCHHMLFLKTFLAAFKLNICRDANLLTYSESDFLCGEVSVKRHRHHDTKGNLSKPNVARLVKNVFTIFYNASICNYPHELLYVYFHYM